MKLPNYCNCYDFIREIGRQSHTLIAGATGSGKSVVINSFISTYVLQCKQPLSASGSNTAGLVLIDPKRVELSKYKDCSHTMAHATEAEDIIKAFKGCEAVMDSRYKTMQRKGAVKWNGQDIYIVVDEFVEIADIKEIRSSVKRIATLGRAANIHLIIATQRPSISDRLIPAVLKANIDCTVCLRTKEAKDSRLICGKSGAEMFPRPSDVGYAECFFCTPGSDQHLKFRQTDDLHIKKIVAFWSGFFCRLRKTKLPNVA